MSVFKLLTCDECVGSIEAILMRSLKQRVCNTTPVTKRGSKSEQMKSGYLCIDYFLQLKSQQIFMLSAL